MNINLNGKPSDIERQKKYNEKHNLIAAWKRRMQVFLGLCRYCGKETSHYCCADCRRKRLGKRICKIPFCQNIPPKGKQFCDEHGSYRSYYQNSSCRVRFNICRYCGKLFTARGTNHITCKTCADNHIQAKNWRIENKERVREIGRNSYHRRKDNPDFKSKQKALRIKNKPRTDKYFKEYYKTEKRVAATKESARKRNLIPGVKEHKIQAHMYSRLFLCDGYMIDKIKKQYKIKTEDVTPEMIVIKRELSIKERLIKELNNVINCR